MSKLEFVTELTLRVEFDDGSDTFFDLTDVNEFNNRLNNLTKFGDATKEEAEAIEQYFHESRKRYGLS